MTSDSYTTATLDNLRPWHRPRTKSTTRPSSSSSQSSNELSRPITPQDSVFTYLHPRHPHRPAVTQRAASAEGYWTQEPFAQLQISPVPTPPRTPSEETHLQPDDYLNFVEISSYRPRTKTVTPATIRAPLHYNPEGMRIPFPGAQRDSSSSTDLPPFFSGSNSACTYDDELGGIPARHPLRNRVNSKGSSAPLNNADSPILSPTKSLRTHTYRPVSASAHRFSSSPPRSSISLRVKPKKANSHRGAMTLFKSLASSNPDPLPKLQDIEFDWAEQRRQNIVQRARMLEQELRYLAESQVQADSQIQTGAIDKGPSRRELPDRPKSWELTPEELELRRDQEEEEGKRFVFKDYVWVNRSYVSAHPKDHVPYPQAYDNVNTQTDRHSHELVKQLFSGHPSIHGDLPQKPPDFVLDLGCGDGTWLLEAAQCWKNTRFYGLDLQSLHPSPEQIATDLGDLADNVRFTYYNFLLDKLPYLDEKFDMVRMSNLKWAIPEDKWDFVFQEVHRILKRGGWVEIIDDDFVLGNFTRNDLSPAQRDTCDIIETHFINMLQARNLLLNTGSQFMVEKLGRWFSAFHEDDFPITISKARPVSIEIQGQGPVQLMLPSDGMSQKAAKLMGFGLDSSHEKHHSAGSTRSRSRSRSGSVSSGVSYSSGVSRSSTQDARRSEDRIDDEQEDTLDEPIKQSTSQPLGLDVLPGRFLPFPPAELSAHAIRNMQSVLASKETIRTHMLKKDPELAALEVKEGLSAEERLRFDELSWEWNEQQGAFDDAFWDFESTMLKRLNLAQPSFDIEDDSDLQKPLGTSQPQPARTASGLSRSNKSGDGISPRPVTDTFTAGHKDIVRHIRVFSGWK